MGSSDMGLPADRDGNHSDHEARHDDGQRYRSRVTLMIKHPSLDPALITKELGVAPKYAWTAGEPWRTPDGMPLPRRRAEPYRCHGEIVQGERFFFEGAVAMLERLEAASDSIRRITGTGGNVPINVGLYGRENIGDVIGTPALMRFAAMKVELGVEVFPAKQQGW